jgi:hypothetical protein
MVGTQNLQVPQLIPHAQLVVCLKLVAVAGSADALKVFPAVWIPCPQSADQCRRVRPDQTRFLDALKLSSRLVPEVSHRLTRGSLGIDVYKGCANWA